MKKITLTVFLIFCINFGFSQTLYSNYLDMTSEWRYLSGGWNGVNASYTDHTTVYFDGLETINGIVYYKKYEKNIHSTTPMGGTTTSAPPTLSGPFYVREDINGKFYRINLSTNLEEVFFDNQLILTSQVGDPFPYPGSSCNVQSIETIYLGSTPLKKVNGTMASNSRGSIEGIGFVGLACGTGVEYSYNLSCYTKQGINIQFGTTNCNSFPVPVRVNLGIGENNLINPIIYPNPTKGTFKVKLSSLNLESEFEVYNSIGIIVKKGVITTDEQIIDISSLSNGIYIVKVFGDNTTKIIKIVKE